MPLDLSDLVKNTRSITVRSATFGVEFGVEYAPAEWGGDVWREVRKAIQDGELDEAYARALCRLIRTWEVTFKGKPVPIVPEVFLGTWRAEEGFRFPLRLVSEIFESVLEDMNPNRS